MKKLILTFVALLFFVDTYGQTPKYDYLLFNSVGDHVNFTFPRELDSLNVKFKKKFKTVPDALGYMNDQGWEIVSANGGVGASIFPAYFVLMRRERK